MEDDITMLLLHPNDKYTVLCCVFKINSKSTVIKILILLCVIQIYTYVINYYSFSLVIFIYKNDSPYKHDSNNMTYVIK